MKPNIWIIIAFGAGLVVWTYYFYLDYNSQQVQTIIWISTGADLIACGFFAQFFQRKNH